MRKFIAILCLILGISSIGLGKYLSYRDHLKNCKRIKENKIKAINEFMKDMNQLCESVQDNSRLVQECWRRQIAAHRELVEECYRDLQKLGCE